MQKPAAPQRESAPCVALSLRQAAVEFRRNRKSLTKRIRRAGIRPVALRCGQPVYAVRDLIYLERQGAEQDPNKMTSFERLAHFKAESARQGVDTMRSTLLRREDVDAEWRRIHGIIDDELDQVGPEVEQAIGHQPDIQAKIVSKVGRMRSLLSDYSDKPQ